MLGTGKPSNKFYIPKNIGYTVKTIIALGEQVAEKNRILYSISGRMTAFVDRRGQYI